MNYEQQVSGVVAPLSELQPTGIQLHLSTGRKYMFYQEDASLVSKICEDLDGQIFARESLILNSAEDVTSFPGRALIGITILTDPLPEAFYETERRRNMIITQISYETYRFRRLEDMARLEGQRSAVLSELEFASGERLFLEFSGFANSPLGERNALHHLFRNPAITCRRLEGGFSVWNTAQLVSWSHYPKLEVPTNAWPAESLAEPGPRDAKVVHLL